MKHSPRHPLLAAALTAVVALGVTACAESPLSSTADLSVRSAATADPTWPEVNLTLCKVGTAANFSVTIDGVQSSRSLAAGECSVLKTIPAATDIGHNITVTELAATGVVLDSIIEETYRWGELQSRVKRTGTATVTAELIPTKGVKLFYFNTPTAPPPPVLEGCTPGYWKQPHHFDSWVGYTPTTLFSDVFENAFPGKTLLDVLSTGGGGLQALGRHTVAALLNAANDDVFQGGTTTADVISAFNAVFPGSTSAYNTLKNRFEAANEAGCSLN